MQKLMMRYYNQKLLYKTLLLCSLYKSLKQPFYICYGWGKDFKIGYDGDMIYIFINI